MKQTAQEGYLLFNGNGTYTKEVDLPEGIFWEEVRIDCVPDSVFEELNMPTAYDLFDSQKAENSLLGLFFSRQTDYRIDKGYISVLMRNKTKDSFRFFKVYIYKLLKENVISQEDYDKSISVITSQNIII